MREKEGIGLRGDGEGLGGAEITIFVVISIVLCILCCILCLLCAVRQRHKAKEQDKEEAKARAKREAGGWAAGSIAADAIERANTHAHADHLPFDDDKDLHVHVPGTHKDIDIHIPKKVRSGIRSLFSAEQPARRK